MDELIERLHEGNYSCVIRKGEMRTFVRRGVADLYDLLMQEPDFLQGAQVADKVVGKAAAALMVLGKIEHLYTDVISRSAWDVLQAAGIAVEAGRVVPRILNRTATGWCPLETICYEVDRAEDMLPLIRNFMEKMRAS